MADGETSNTYTSKDFKPNVGASGNYQYDANGNQTVNKDKRISETNESVRGWGANDVLIANSK